MAAVAPATQCSRTQCSRYTVRPAIQCGPHTVQPPTQCRPLYSAARYFREIEKSGAVHGAHWMRSRHVHSGDQNMRAPEKTATHQSVSRINTTNYKTNPFWSGILFCLYFRES